MSIDIKFEIMGQTQLSRTFDRLSIGTGNMRIPFADITKDFYRTQKSIFQSEGSFEGNPKWKRLNPKYQNWKEGRGGGKILVLSGRLKKSATTKSAEGSIYKITSKSLVMGSNVPVGGWNLAALHQFGTSKMPAREVIRLTTPQKKRWVRFVRDYIHKIIRRN